MFGGRRKPKKLVTSRSLERSTGYIDKVYIGRGQGVVLSGMKVRAHGAGFRVERV